MTPEERRRAKQDRQNAARREARRPAGAPCLRGERDHGRDAKIFAMHLRGCGPSEIAREFRMTKECAYATVRRVSQRGVVTTIEPQEQWVGLAYVEKHGLPGYPPVVPPPRLRKPCVYKEQVCSCGLRFTPKSGRWTRLCTDCRGAVKRMGAADSVVRANKRRQEAAMPLEWGDAT